eukprot:Em0001g1454a
MRLELVCALLVIAVATIGTSAEYSGSQNDVDDERSVQDAVDDDDVQNVLGDDEQSVLGDGEGRSVRDAVDDDDVQNVLGDEEQSVLGDGEGRSVRDSPRCKACYRCRSHHWHIRCLSLCKGC